MSRTAQETRDLTVATNRGHIEARCFCVCQKPYKSEALLNITMATKKCCYMDRDCTSECVAYLDVSELREMAKGMGLSDVHCIRVFMELSHMMTAMDTMGFEDFEGDDDEF